MYVQKHVQKHVHEHIHVHIHVHTHVVFFAQHDALRVGAHWIFSAVTAPPGTHAHPEHLDRDDHEYALDAQKKAVANSQLSSASRW